MPLVCMHLYTSLVSFVFSSPFSALSFNYDYCRVMTIVSVAFSFHLRLNFQLLKGALKKKIK